MTLFVSDFVYGNINMSEIPDKPHSRKLSDDNGNSMEISLGEKLIICSNIQCQKWIFDGIIEEFEPNADRNRILLDGTSTCTEGAAYIGKLT